MHKKSIATTSFEDMSHLQLIQQSLDPDTVIFSQITLNDGDEESPGLVQPTSNARMTDEQSTPVKTLCRYLDIQ
ncbi:unnamed protein product [Clavelina lepadiformis]|uniref:Uncharacterized protein n=1 Tax=Clavelina lepadiformis TaxID=159417 RepID=A0ABP0GE60_CLALP